MDGESCRCQGIPSRESPDHYPVLLSVGVPCAEEDGLSLLQPGVNAGEMAGAVGNRDVIPGPVQITGWGIFQLPHHGIGVNSGSRTEGFHHGHRCGSAADLEVKSSVEDFHSKNGHNFIGEFNYYVMPEEVYEKVRNEIPYYVGVYVPDGMHYKGQWYNLKSIKKARKKDRSRPMVEMLLMMFRSAARDRQIK